MKCPNDQSTLVMSDRQGIEIDYCPECRGVWLDRGELDKIIDRASTAQPPAASAHAASAPPFSQQPSYGQQQYGDRPYDRDHGDRDYDDRRPNQPYDHAYGKRRKKENWLSDLFD